LNPDIVITHSDFQHEVASELIRNHQCVLATNQLNVMEILDTIERIGAIASVPAKAASLRSQMVTTLKKQLKKANELPARPRVYFEEWDDPMICSVEWVSEMIEIAGGQDIFRNRSKNKGHLERQVSLSEVIENDPDIIIASWCGKPANLKEIADRNGWQAIRAVKTQRIFEMQPEITLQPGPRITEGIAEMSELFRKWNT
jgi:iron complex transport system substrate-binding protein